MHKIIGFFKITHRLFRVGCKLQNFLYSSTTNYIDMSKRTYQPSKQKRATTHGFLVRMATAAGAKVILARRRKGRAQLTVKPSKAR